MSFKALISEKINREINWPFSILTVLAVILTRNFLEIFSSPFYQGDFFPGFFVFLHSPLFYISVIFSLVLLVFYLAKLEFKQAFNLGILFSPIMLIPPLIDLLVSGGRGAGIAYLFFNSFSEMLPSLFSFFGRFIDPGITLGIRIEIALILIVIGYLIYRGTKNLKKTILGVIIGYLLIFFYFSFPSIFGLLFGNIEHFRFISGSGSNSAIYLTLNDLFSNSLANSIHYLHDLPADTALLFNQQFYVLINRLVWLFVLVQAFWLFYLGNRRVFDAWRKNLRWERVFYYMAISILGLFLGWRVSAMPHSFNSLDILGLLVFSILVALSFWLAVGINDLADGKTDSLSNPGRPLVKGTITVREQNLINLVLFLFIVMGAATINYLVLILFLLFQAVYFVYSAPPLRLKKIFGLSSLLVGSNALLMAMAGFYFVAPIQKFSFFPKSILALILFVFTLWVNVKDVKDHEGDKAEGIKTIPVIFGLKWGKRIISALVILALLTIALVFKLNQIVIASVIFSIISFLLINREDYEERPIFIAFFLYLAICIASLTFS